MYNFAYLKMHVITYLYLVIASKSTRKVNEKQFRKKY